MKVSLCVVAFWHRTTSDNASGQVDLVSCGWYMFVSLCSLALVIVEMRRPSWAWSSTESKEAGKEVISNLEAAVYVSVGPKSIHGVTEDPFGFRCLGSNAREDGCP